MTNWPLITLRTSGLKQILKFRLAQLLHQLASYIPFAFGVLARTNYLYVEWERIISAGNQELNG